MLLSCMCMYVRVSRLTMTHLVSKILALAVTLLLIGADAHDRPIIGIVAQETSSGYGDTMIPTAYVKWMEMGGARVLAIRLYETDAYYDDIFHKVNGLLIPGGSVSVTTSQFAKASRKMLDRAMQANLEGGFFPVWGICLGFQVLVNYVAGRNRLYVTPGMGDVSLPLIYSDAASRSRLLKDAPKEIYDSLKVDNFTYHTHKYGVHLWKFETQSELVNFFSVVTTNKDADGRAFASMVEAKDPKYPIYGSQWHPEKNSFDWDPTKAVNHSASAIRAAQYFANFFVGEARKNTHRFADVSQEGRSLIQTERRRYFTVGRFQENFYLDYAA